MRMPSSASDGGMRMSVTHDVGRLAVDSREKLLTVPAFGDHGDVRVDQLDRAFTVHRAEVLQGRVGAVFGPVGRDEHLERVPAQVASRRPVHLIEPTDRALAVSPAPDRAHASHTGAHTTRRGCTPRSRQSAEQREDAVAVFALRLRLRCRLSRTAERCR
jgi:hypothetical protein